LFFTILFIAHIQSVLIPIILALKSINNFKHLVNYPCIPLGFLSIGLASIFETIDHTFTDWIYINHTTKWNWLFYAFLSLGLILLAISITRKKRIIFINSFLYLGVISSYWIYGKPASIFFQGLISLYLIINWSKKFKDWLIFAYPIFGILLTTSFGSSLSLTSNQIWHIFIGPSGSISVLIFYFVLKRSNINQKK